MANLPADPKSPDRLWLQRDEGPDFEWTWCSDKINDDDVEYIRADRVDELIRQSHDVPARPMNQQERDAMNRAADASAVDVSCCWCHKCNPQNGFNHWMILCPDCGNKRCPKASDHALAYTRSNDAGQSGSVYA